MATQTERKPSNNCMRLTRNVPTMPDWVTEQSDRVGPKPPSPPTTPNPSNKSAKPPPLLPPKTTNKSPEPDYEIIEFSGQQYSNQPVTRAEMRSKTPDTKPKCTLCGSNNPWVRCDECAHQIFCASCDDMFHRHPKRKNHLRKALEETRPPLPAKTLPGQPRPSPPVPPPRRSKRGNAATPLMPRKDQVRASVKGPVVPSSPTPSDTSRNGIWSERGTDSLIRGMNFSNRPLPDTPKTPTTPSDDLMSSRSTTPRSVFDAIQRPPSVTLEKIKSKASATLDRMTQLQQRYRLQKEERERNRSGSVTDQNFSFDQWPNISPSPSHFRSGSISSGINLSHIDLSEDSHFNLFHQRHTQNKQPLSQHHHHQSHFPDDRNVHLGQRQTSTSVFNLNQLNRRPTPVEMNENQWPESNQMQQAHSMAHLNWSNNHHRPQASDHWNNQFCTNQQLNRSNLSLNVGAGYLVPPQHPINMYPTPQPPAPPPPVFMNTRGIMPNMYPYPYPGMPFMSPGIVAMPPPPRSRAASRASSRIPSPTLSRKSLSLRNKKRSSFTETEPTDDEDSDQYDRRSLMSNRSGMGDVPRQRRVPQSLLDDSESNHSYNLRTKIREQRHGSFAKPALNQNEWLPERRASTSNVRPNDAGIGLAPLKSSRIYSDLDSEGSAGTRALVQAKIQQKLDKEPIKRRSSRGKDSTIAKQRNGTEVVKKSTEVQAGRVRSTKESTEEDRQKFSDKENIYPNDASTRLKESQERSEESPKDINESVDDESEEEIVKEDKNESPPLGPPPGTPDHEWECEFCTFVNEPKVKICTICCKTPSRAPESNRSKTQSVPVQAKQLAETSTNRATASKQRQATTSKELAVQTKVLPIDRTGKPNEAKTTPKKDSEPFDDDIWATLEENIQAAAGAVILKAESRIQKEASTDRGTPPVHQTRPESDVFAREKTAIQNHKNLTLNSATVPPPGPQNISTQTYETLPVVPQQKQEERNGGFDGILDNRRELENRTPIDQVSSALTSGNNLQFVRDQMLLQMERERYRSSSDLRRIDISPMDYSPVSGLGRRQSSVAELLLLHRGQQQQQQLQSYSPLPGLPLDPGSYHEMKPLRDPETELYLLIKEAELHKFTSEELHIALKFCGNDTHPVQWLRENWFKLVRTVQNLATKYGQERAENTIGTISENEAREALRIHFGNIWQAVSECIEQRQKKFRELSYRGNFSREDIVTALTTYHGNIEASFADLNKTQLSPIVVNIWGSPAGAENESGVEVQNRTSSSAPNVIDANSAEADIHQFLSKNASQCFADVTASFQTKDKLLTQSSTPNDFHHDYHHHDHQLSLRNTPENVSPNVNHSFHRYKNEDVEKEEEYEKLHNNNNNNNNILKDLETLIGNIENNQNHLNGITRDKEYQVFDNDLATDSDEESKRIFTKSPINFNQKSKTTKSNESVADPADVKSFVWQHIQEIVPDLVKQVEKELMERDKLENPETDLDEVVAESMLSNIQKLNTEEIINRKLSLKFSLLENEQSIEFFDTVDIPTFQMHSNHACLVEHTIDYIPLSFKAIPVKCFKMFASPQAQMDFQDVLEGRKQQTSVPRPQTVDHQGESNKDEGMYKDPSNFTLNTERLIDVRKGEDANEHSLPSSDIQKYPKRPDTNAEDRVDWMKHKSSHLYESRQSSENIKSSRNIELGGTSAERKEQLDHDYTEKFKNLLDPIPSPRETKSPNPSEMLRDNREEKVSDSSDTLSVLPKTVSRSSEKFLISQLSNSSEKLSNNSMKSLEPSEIQRTPSRDLEILKLLPQQHLHVFTDHLEKLSQPSDELCVVLEYLSKHLQNMPEFSKKLSETSRIPSTPVKLLRPPETPLEPSYVTTSLSEEEVISKKRVIHLENLQGPYAKLSEPSEYSEDLSDKLPNPSQKRPELLTTLGTPPELMESPNMLPFDANNFKKLSHSSEKLAGPPDRLLDPFEKLLQSFKGLPDSSEELTISSKKLSNPSVLPDNPPKGLEPRNILVKPLHKTTNNLQQISDPLGKPADPSKMIENPTIKLPGPSEESSNILEKIPDVIEKFSDLTDQPIHILQSDEDIITNITTNKTAEPEDESQNVAYKLKKVSSEIQLNGSHSKNNIISRSMTNGLDEKNNENIENVEEKNYQQNQPLGEFKSEGKRDVGPQRFNKKDYILKGSTLLTKTISVNHANDENASNKEQQDNNDSLNCRSSSPTESSTTNNILNHEIIKPVISLGDIAGSLTGRTPTDIPATARNNKKPNTYLNKSKIPVRKKPNYPTDTRIEHSEINPFIPNPSKAIKDFNSLSSVVNEKGTNEEGSIIFPEVQDTITTTINYARKQNNSYEAANNVEIISEENQKNERSFYQDKEIIQEKNGNLQNKSFAARIDNKKPGNISQNVQNPELEIIQMTVNSNYKDFATEFKEELTENHDGNTPHSTDDSINISDRNLVKSPNSEAEVFIVLDYPDQLHEPSRENIVASSQLEENDSLNEAGSTTTTTAATTTTATITTPTTSYPSKQNLTELVEDTQRLIKQMKDEISLADLESSEEYSDEYSEDYEEEDYEDEEEWEDGEEETGEEAEGQEDWINEEDDIEEIYFEEENEDDNGEITGFGEDDVNEEEKIGHKDTAVNGKRDASEEIEASKVVADEKTPEKIAYKHDDSTRLFDKNQKAFNKKECNDLSSTQSHESERTLGEKIALQNDITEEKTDNTTQIETSLSSSSSSKLATYKGFINAQNSFTSLIDNEIIDEQLITEDLSQIVNNESIPRGKSVSPSNALKITSSAAASELNHNIAEIESPVRSLKEALGPTAGVNEELSRNESQLLVLDEGEHLLTHSQSINSSKTNTKVNLQVLTKESNQNSGEERNQHPQVVEKILTEVHRNITDSTPQTKIGAHNSPAIQKPSDKIDLHNKGSEEYPTASAQEKTSDTQTNPDLKVSSTTNPAQHLESAAGIIEVALNEPQKEAPTTSKTLIKNSSNFSNPSKIPKPKSSKIQQKIPTRSKSFSIPSPTHIGVSSVKAIKQEYLNQQKPLKKSTETKVLNSATAAKRKNSITAVISKLNQTGAANNGTSLSPTRTGMNGRGFLRSHSQPRIPKKNYHETCFSDDDYESSDATDNEEKTKEKYDEEMNQLDDSSSEMHQRKQSVPVFRAYPVVQEPEAVNPEELARQFLDNKVVSNEAEAQVAATLVSMKFQKDVSLWAAKECTDLQHAIALLQQECELCTGTFALNQMVSMLKCTHKCCKQCAQTYFTVQITDRSINDCNCPFCKVPELHEQNQHEDENLEYFSNLDILLKNILDPPVHELFQRKLRDRTLLQDPNFKWCVQCSSGFFARPKQRRLICPDCGSVTCSQCRKKWEKQHEELSCEKFLAWKEANDPEVQAQGVQQHLAQNGIDCPKCKFRYSLTRGGCMHFTCTQCKFEFCYGCSKPFMMGAKCKKSPYCSKLGLHAHHPRNCLFYLRDKLPMQLQFLLKQNSVNYEVESLPAVTNDGTTNHRSGLCPIQIQKETPKGLVDTVCNVDITDKEAGLCRTHYVEYLSATVAKAGIDPLPIFDLTDCVQELRRRGIPLPERGPWDTDEIYKNMCAEIIKEKIPLNSD